MIEHALSLPVIHLTDLLQVVSFSQWVHLLIVHVLSIQAQKLTTKKNYNKPNICFRNLKELQVKIQGENSG